MACAGHARGPIAKVFAVCYVTTLMGLSWTAPITPMPPFELPAHMRCENATLLRQYKCNQNGLGPIADEFPFLVWGHVQNKADNSTVEGVLVLFDTGWMKSDGALTSALAADLGLTAYPDGTFQTAVQVTVWLTFSGLDGHVVFKLQNDLVKLEGHEDGTRLAEKLPRPLVVAGPSAWRRHGLTIVDGRPQYCPFLPDLLNLAGFKSETAASEALNGLCSASAAAAITAAETCPRSCYVIPP